MPEFVGFCKIARLNRPVIVTEKIDGTNACVVVSDDGQVYAQSRNRIITPEDDNFGFAQWVRDNERELAKLGPGHHFGEWWGRGIQRDYGLRERRFSLFNTERWGNPLARPNVCHIVPVLARGILWDAVLEAMAILRANGSAASLGYPNPEGVVVFHKASNTLFKVTLDDDDMPKSITQ